MAIVTVSTSNTFNEWRVVTNQLVTEVNKTESGTATLSADTLTANTITANGDIAVNGGDITTTQSTANVFNTTATTLNIGGAATTLELGAATGNTNINNNLIVDGNTTVSSLTTNNGVVFATNSGKLNTNSNITWNGTVLDVNGNVSARYFDAVNGVNLNYATANTVAYVNSSGALVTNSNLGWNGTTFAVTGDSTVSGNTSITGTLGVTGNVTLAGELRGPATFTIDPAAVGDNTGTVVIKGNLQVDGTTTTINSTTLTVDDLNIVLADGAANAAAANGAGITISGASATIAYLSSGDKFSINKAVDLENTLSVTSNTTLTGTTVVGSGTPSSYRTLNVLGSQSIERYGATPQLAIRGGTDSSTGKEVRLNVSQTGFSISANTIGATQDSWILADFANPDLRLYNNGTEGIRIASTEVVINDPSNDIDFRVESNNNTHMIFVDASADGVNIGGSDTIQGQLNVIKNTGDGVASTTGLYITTGQTYGSNAAPKNLDLVFQGYRDGAGSGNGAKARLRAIERTGDNRASSLQIDALDTSGNLQTTFIGGSTEVSINEGGIDMDFRVESDTNAHAFFVDAGNSKISINTSDTSQATFTVAGPGTSTATTAFFTNVDGTYNPYLMIQHLGSAGVKILESSSYGGGASRLNLEVAGADCLNLTPGEVAINDGSADMDFRIESDTSTHAFFVDAGNNRVAINSSSNHAGSRLYVEGDITANYNQIIALRYNSSGNTNAYYKGMSGSHLGNSTARGLHIFNYDQDSDLGINFWSGRPGAGTPVLLATFNDGSVVFNEDGNDQDFRIESDTDAYAVFVDAGNNVVGIGTSTPNTYGGKLAVAGNVVPTANVTHDLGTSTYRWRDLYLSGSTIYMGSRTVNLGGVNPFIKPSLVLDFAGADSVDNRISYKRASRATVINKLGFIETVQEDSPRINYDASTKVCRGLLVEPGQTNRIQYSENFNIYWTQSMVQVKPNAGLAPDGTYSASQIVDNEISDTHQLYHIRSTAATTYTLSVYAKANGSRNLFEIHLYTENGVTNRSARFNLSTGQVVSGNATGIRITNEGNGWYRCSITNSVNASDSFYPLFRMVNASGQTAYVGDRLTGILLWGAQLEESSYLSSYIPSNPQFLSRSTAATYFDENGTLRVAPINAHRAAAHFYDVTTGKWTQGGKLIAEYGVQNLMYNNMMAGYEPLTTVQSLDGGITIQRNWWQFDKYISVPNGNAGWCTVYSVTGGYGTSLTNGSNYCLSCYSNRAEPFELYINSNANYIFTNVIQVAPGVYRHWVVHKITSAGTISDVHFRSAGVHGVRYLAGFQLEAVFIPTSLIYTFGSIVTRNSETTGSSFPSRAVDNPVINKSELEPVLNKYEGTLYSQGTFFLGNVTYNNPSVYMSDGTTSNYVALFGYTSSYGWAQASGSTQAGITGGSTSENTEYRLAFGYKTNDFAFSMNGALSGVDSSGTVPIVDRMAIGWRLEDASVSFGGHIKKIMYYPKRLSNDELQALTQ